MPKIFLDIGHGGRDPGAVKNGIQEKDIVLDMGLRIGRKLATEFDCQVFYSRVADIFLDLRPRALMANQLGADLFVSLHCNSFTTGVPNGYEDFIRINHDIRTGEIRNAIHTAVSAVWTKYNRANRGRKFQNFAVLRHARMPAVLVENGFLANVRDAELLRDMAFMIELINAHVDGIVRAMKLAPTQQQPPAPTPAHREYVVQAGDTLWSIAASQLGNGTRHVEISTLNKLTSNVVTPGQKLMLPN